MISMRLDEAAGAMTAELVGGDRSFKGVSTDTRQLSDGELFFALKGPRFDGHEMCSQAERLGAAACVVERPVSLDIPSLVVDDTRRSLGRLARAWRRRLDIEVVGVTGSNGKTTVKEMVSSILRQAGDVLATQGNLNNDIGVPKTLFELDAGHDYAVVEMGANHVGEIAELASIALPDVGVVTLCAPAHLEGFGSIERVASAKGELFAALPDTGTAVINADDKFCGLWRRLAGDRRRIEFGINNDADVRAADIQALGLGRGMSFELVHGGVRTAVTIPLDGSHNVMNALAAGACGFALGLDTGQIVRGLAAVHPVGGRLNVIDAGHGLRVIDDTYNANPTSLAAAVDMSRVDPNERWLVLGEMAELGEAADSLHEQSGRQVKAAGITRLFTVGAHAEASSIAFGEGARHYASQDQLIESVCNAVRRRSQSPLTILVKGSRSTHMEDVVAALTALGAGRC